MRSQHIDTSKNSKATLKSCYALHSYMDRETNSVQTLKRNPLDPSSIRSHLAVRIYTRPK